MRQSLLFSPDISWMASPNTWPTDLWGGEGGEISAWWLGRCALVNWRWSTGDLDQQWQWDDQRGIEGKWGLVRGGQCVSGWPTQRLVFQHVPWPRVLTQLQTQAETFKHGNSWYPKKVGVNQCFCQSHYVRVNNLICTVLADLTSMSPGLWSLPCPIVSWL